MDSYWSPTGVLESSRNRWRSEKYWLRRELLGSHKLEPVQVVPKSCHFPGPVQISGAVQCDLTTSVIRHFGFQGFLN